MRQVKRQKSVAKENHKSRGNENSSLHETWETLGSRDDRCVLGTDSLLWDSLTFYSCHVCHGSRWETGLA